MQFPSGAVIPDASFSSIRFSKVTVRTLDQNRMFLGMVKFDRLRFPVSRIFALGDDFHRHVFTRRAEFLRCTRKNLRPSA